MNNRRHSGNSSTVITSSNAFDNDSTKQADTALIDHSTTKRSPAPAYLQANRNAKTIEPEHSIGVANKSIVDSLTIDDSVRAESILLDDRLSLDSVNNAFPTDKRNFMIIQSATYDANIINSKNEINSRKNTDLTRVFKTLSAYLSNSMNETLSYNKHAHIHSTAVDSTAVNSDCANDSNNCMKIKPQQVEYDISTRKSDMMDHSTVFESANGVAAMAHESIRNVPALGLHGLHKSKNNTSPTPNKTAIHHQQQQPQSSPQQQQQQLLQQHPQYYQHHRHDSSDSFSSNDNINKNSPINGSADCAIGIRASDDSISSSDRSKKSSRMSSSVTLGRLHEYKTDEIILLPRVTLKERYVHSICCLMHSKSQSNFREKIELFY